MISLARLLVSSMRFWALLSSFCSCRTRLYSRKASSSACQREKQSCACGLCQLHTQNADHPSTCPLRLKLKACPAGKVASMFTPGSSTYQDALQTWLLGLSLHMLLSFNPAFKTRGMVQPFKAITTGFVISKTMHYVRSTQRNLARMHSHPHVG